MRKRNNKEKMDPTLKWAGGKRRLISDITALFPKNYQKLTYHEVFFGSGALFFKINPFSGTINDINPRLMNFYKIIRDNPEELITLTSQYEYNENTYYQLRDKFNQTNLSNIESASLLLYLNKTAYNGLYRVNSKGKFNVPFGRYYNPTIVPKARIISASKVLKNIEIFCTDFSYIKDYANTGDLCYFDPPYHPISSTANFTSYSSNGFNFKDQMRLRDICLNLDEKGVFFVLSNAHTSEIIDLYEEIKSFRIETVKTNRNISCKKSTRGPINEILVTNIPKKSSFGKETYRYQEPLIYYHARV